MEDIEENKNSILEELSVDNNYSKDKKEYKEIISSVDISQNLEIDKENINKNESGKFSNSKLNIYSNLINSHNSNISLTKKINSEYFDIEKIDTNYYKDSIINYVNLKRKSLNLPELFQDITLSLVSQQFCENSWMLEDENQSSYKSILDKFKCNIKFEKIVTKFDLFDFKVGNLTKRNFKLTVMEILNVMFECPEEREILLNKNLNSCGIGFYVNEQYICVVITMSYLALEIEEIRLSEIGYLEIKGKVFEKNKGLYAVRIIFAENEKERMLINYQYIEFDLEKNFFTVSVEFDEDLNNPMKFAEFFLKEDPWNIKYGKKCPIQHISKSYSVDLRIPLIHKMKNSSKEIFSFFNYVDFKTNNSEVSVKKENSLNDNENSKYEENNKTSKKSSYLSMVNENKSASSHIGSSSEEEEEEEEENEESYNIGVNMNDPNMKSRSGSIKEFFLNNLEEKEVDGDTPDKDLQNELEKAEKEARYELKIQMEINKKLQFVLHKIWKKNDIKLQVQNVMNNTNMMSKIKYHNSLALIHQIAQELEKINQKYNKIASDLNERLKEKTESYEIIKSTFDNLKNEIAKKAVYTRNLKKIPKNILVEIKADEERIEKMNKDMRINLIKLRMNLEKKLKYLDKKNQFSDGHHLIDFEKFKIENQNLNEKIAERNDEIFKLKKKNHSNIQILAHLMEKLNYENQEIEKLSNIFDTLSNLKRRRL